VTWTKTGSEFPDDAYNVELTDAAYRTHHEAITYLFKLERSDCYVRTDEVRRFAGSPHADMAVTELVNLGWWRVKGQGYEVLHHADVIRGGIVAQVNKRSRNKRNQQAWRQRQAGADESADVSAYADRQTDKQASTPEPEATGWPHTMEPTP
jgi:coenzyme F420-reducing hydrogenase alpha subunit